MFHLVGRPYKFPSSPPESFDCWTLVKYIRAQKGLSSPLPFDDQEEWCVPGALARAVGQARPVWQVLKAPQDFCMAVLEPGHVGIYYQGGVMHALARNFSVIWTRDPVVKRVWPNVEWWNA